MAYRLSPTALELFKECQRCFWYDRKGGIPRPRGIFPSLPGGYDRVTKDYFDVFRRKGEMPPEEPFAELGGQGYRFFPDAHRLAVWRDARTAGIEWFDEKRNRFFGALDDLLENTNTNKVAVFDVKTKGKEPQDDATKWNVDQMSAYAFLLQKNGFEVEDEAILAYYCPERINPDVLRIEHGIKILRVKVDPEAALERFENALCVLESPAPPPASEDCASCDWLKKRAEAEGR